MRIPCRRNPKSIRSSVLGEFRFERSQWTDGVYRPVLPLRVKSRIVATDPGGTDWSVWGPKDGVRDTAAFVSIVESRAKFVCERLDDVLRAALPRITGAIDEFWRIPDEEAPGAEAILRAGELRYMCLSAGGGGHRIIIYDRGDLIGGHDLIIETDSDFRPVSVHFDG